MSGEETIFSVPLHDSEFLGRIIDSVPDAWSRLSGWLEAPESARSGVACDTGYAWSSNEAGLIRIIPRYTNPPRAVVWNPLALLIENKLPGFITFEETGRDGRKAEFKAAKQAAANFVRQGYVGWLRFEQNPEQHSKNLLAWLKLELRTWQRHDPELRRSVEMQPSAVLGFNSCFGGSEARLAPILRVCQSTVMN